MSAWKKYDIYKFIPNRSYEENNTELVKTGLTYKEAIKFMASVAHPTEYLVQPYTVYKEEHTIE